MENVIKKDILNLFLLGINLCVVIRNKFMRCN
jgi:hypothetical protein